MYFYQFLGILIAAATATACYYRIRQALTDPFEPFQPKPPIMIRIPFPEWLYVKGEDPDWGEFRKKEETTVKRKKKVKDDQSDNISLPPAEKKEFTGEVKVDRDGGEIFEW